MKFIKFLFIIPFLFSCSSMVKTVPVADAPHEYKLEKLKRNEYKVYERTSGTGKTVKLFNLIELAPNFLGMGKSECAGYGSQLDMMYASKAQRMAAYKALEGHDDADALLEPRIVVEKGGFPFIIVTETAHVSGKPISLKIDSELPKQDVSANVYNNIPIRRSSVEKGEPVITQPHVDSSHKTLSSVHPVEGEVK